MEPIPESQRAVDMFGPFMGGDDILEYLMRSADMVRVFVPSCIGLSLAVLDHGVSFTLVATSAEVAALDGVQYVDGGPCVQGAHEDKVMTYNEGDPTDEARWELFSRATAARGVASTLTLPITEGAEVTGSVNLYAATPHAFDGHQQQVAVIFGAWAEGAVLNADLRFDTKRTAQQAPQVLHSAIVVSQAVGLLAAARDLGVDAAHALVMDAASRAGVAPVEVAQQILDSYESDSS